MLAKENYDGTFDIQRGMATIVLVKPLDAEDKSLYNLTVQVTDGTNSATTQVGYQESCHFKAYFFTYG